MEWKRLRIKGKVISAKRIMSNLLRLMGASEKEDSNVSPPVSVSGGKSYETMRLLTNHSLEVELKKAEALEYWRRWLNQLK